MKQDIDKLKQAIIDGIEVADDIKKALEDDGKISLLEGSALVLTNGGKAVRLIGALHEIWEEIKDLDSIESSELVTLLMDSFDPSPEAHDAIVKIAEGAGSLNQGFQELIKLKNKD